MSVFLGDFHDSLITLSPCFSSGAIPYPREHVFLSIKEQLIRLSELNHQFPNLFKKRTHVNDALLEDIESGKQVLVNKAEGWIVLPHWSAVASCYEGAIEKVFGVCSELFGTDTEQCLSNRLNLYYLRETSQKSAFLRRMVIQQKTETLLVPVQFGNRFQDASVFDLYREINSSHDEFAFGIYELLMMLLLFPNRLRSNKSLQTPSNESAQQAIFASGDMFSRTGQQSYTYSPIIFWTKAGLTVGYADRNHKSPLVSHPTGFLFSKIL